MTSSAEKTRAFGDPAVAGAGRPSLTPRQVAVIDFDCVFGPLYLKRSAERGTHGVTPAGVADQSQRPADASACVVFWQNLDDKAFSARVTQLQNRVPSDMPAVVVTDMRAHWCSEVRAREQQLMNAVPAVKSVIRATLIPDSELPLGRSCARWSWLWPLLPPSARCAFTDMDSLIHAVDGQLDRPRQRVLPELTLLGKNRSWPELLRQRSSGTSWQHFLTAVAYLLRLLLVRWIVRGAIRLAVRWKPRWKRLFFDTIIPESQRELLSLCHSHNLPWIQIAGYNNGVTHFGWAFPGRTVIPTIRSGSRMRVGDHRLTVDAGVTLRNCIARLADAGQELHVVPNFSYIAVGTSFFVPVHGSGSEVSTLGTTIERVLLFDPRVDEFVRARRGDAVFDDAMYSRGSGLVLLRLTLSTRPRRNYFVRHSQIPAPSANEVWNVFQDPEPSNIEIRRNRASAQTIDVYRYYASAGSGDGRLEVPRDSIGRLWDRLEENRLTAFLFHWLVRRLAFHVELFMTQGEFATFWSRHAELKVSKTQLRYVRADGMKHSPFGEGDRLSADVFMSRRRRDAFTEFVRRQMPDVRTNPGKQSM